MNISRQGLDGGLTGMMARMWLDGLDGQEDELQDVHDGKLNLPTAEHEREIVIRPNRAAIEQEKKDEG